MMLRLRANVALLTLALAVICLSGEMVVGAKITSPKEQFGFNLGDDYCLANYQQLVEYWRKLESESNRLRLEDIGKTEEGRDMLLAIVTSSRNQKKLEKYRRISQRLALAEGLDDKEARKLAAEGKAVVWIDGGLHATEVLGAQQLMETVYQMTSRNDREMRRFLDDVIVLFCCPNPDGLDLVADWYMRNKDPKKRSTGSLPRLYQKYIGHDNNRDFYMVTQKETEAVCRVFFHDWFPQIIYNHHQSGPSGAVLFAPPFRDPFNYDFDPLIPLGIDLVGAAMHNRFAAEGKGGATMRKGANYSTWWNGGLRTTAYFHNMIGLLTETIGHPTPMEIPLRLQRQLPKADLPLPIAPQKWRFRQSVEYMLTANWAVIDVASRYREPFLLNAYKMGRNSIERGSQDEWTMRPERIQAAEEAAAKLREQAVSPTASKPSPSKPSSSTEKGKAEPSEQEQEKKPDVYKDVLHDLAFRDPRGFILPSDQPDFLTATKFVNTLIKNGVTVLRATSWFEVGGESYPAGSYVVKTAQAFRPHIMSMFEPQNHPDDIPCPGGAPVPPYDSAGWTLAYQMGVQFDRILDGFSGPFEKIEGLARPPAGALPRPKRAAGFLLDRAVNDSFIVVNRLLKNDFDAARLKAPLDWKGKKYPAGTWYVPNRAKVTKHLREWSSELGVNFVSLDKPPSVDTAALHPVRIGLWDRYGGSISSGWTRWILEQFEFDYRVVYAPELDKGDLADRYDVLIFVTGGIPQSSRRGAPRLPDKKAIPKEYHDRLGAVTVEKTVPQLKTFVEQGGSLLAIGSSTAIARHFGVPIRNALATPNAEGRLQPLGRDKYYAPGSVLQVRVDPSSPLALGMGERADVFFNNSPVFRLSPEAVLQGARPVAWFDSDSPLRSGWTWGERYLKDGVVAVEVPVGKGSLFLFGPEIAFRAQPHGTFKFLFNGIYGGDRKAAR